MVGKQGQKISDAKTGIKEETGKFWQVMKEELKKDFEKTTEKLK